MRAYPGVVSNVAYSRHYVYSGIALYGAVVPAGMPAYQSIAPQPNGLVGLPEIQRGAGYYWAANAIVALATVNRRMFTAANGSSNFFYHGKKEKSFA